MKIQSWKIKTGMAAVIAAIGFNAHGTLFTYTWSPGATIPDGTGGSYINNQTIGATTQGNNLPSNPLIVSVASVTLNLSGGWNGDLVAYLRYDDGNGGVGFTTLLNQLGTGGGNPIGYTDAGMNVTLVDHGSYGDIHTYGGGGAPSGTYLVDQTGSSTSFSSFGGLDPTAGTWSLFFQDMSGNGQISTLNSWTLDLEVVPEPVNVALGVFGGLLGGGALVRWLAAKRRSAAAKPA